MCNLLRLTPNSMFLAAVIPLVCAAAACSDPSQDKQAGNNPPAGVLPGTADGGAPGKADDPNAGGNNPTVDAGVGVNTSAVKFPGINYSSMRTSPSGGRRNGSYEEIVKDLRVLSRYTDTIRIYTPDENIVRAAAAVGVKVYVGTYPGYTWNGSA